jgi:GT2 family glycosyltransferase
VLINKKQQLQVQIDLKYIELGMLNKNKSLQEKVSIVIVNTNELVKLKRCLASIMAAKASSPLEIIVVDNNSSDGTTDFLAKNYPAVKLVKNINNLGYPRSVNNGLRAASSNYCLILNPDIIVLPGAIEIMLDYMLAHPRAGIAGCRLFNENGSLQYSVRRFLDLRTYLYRFTPLRGLMAGSALERFYLMQDWDHKDNRMVDWVLGGCMMVRKEAMDEVGMMDEKIFLYFDDVDWCYRMWEKGWQVAYVADAAMVHKHERTSANKLFNRATREHFKSLFYFLRKYGFKIPFSCPSNQE